MAFSEYPNFIKKENSPMTSDKVVIIHGHEQIKIIALHICELLNSARLS